MIRTLCLLLALFSSLNFYAQHPMPRATPAEMGLDSSLIFHKVDSLVTIGIKNNAFPGATILVAKDGKVVFHESYGFHTYDSITETHPDDLYDLASVTKILGPLPVIMKLVEEGKLDLDTPFSEYWTSWRHIKDKKQLTLREILAHQAGLVPYIVFLNKAMHNSRLRKRFVRHVPNRRFQKQAFDSLYVNNRFVHKMFRMINRSEVASLKTYNYSGLAFLLFPELIHQLTGTEYETYLRETFFDPLGCKTLVFNPKKKGLSNAIVPTELDTLFRKALTQGWVHDENASLLGGISGNAGLFGTAEDLGKIMQLYQNYGIYEGRRYLSESIVKEFARVQYPDNDNRRGLGYDKPIKDNWLMPLPEAYPAPSASPESFGHSGFTGTFVWADPINQLVFIFLSNRVNPTRENRNLYTLNLRPALQQVFYDAGIVVEKTMAGDGLK